MIRSQRSSASFPTASCVLQPISDFSIDFWTPCKVNLSMEIESLESFQRPSFAQYTSKFVNCSPQYSTQPILAKKQGAICCVSTVTSGIELICPETMNKLKYTVQLWNTQQEYPNVSHSFSPLKTGKASISSGYQSHKIFITKKKNPYYRSPSTEPPSPDPSEKCTSWSFFWNETTCTSEQLALTTHSYLICIQDSFSHF